MRVFEAAGWVGAIAATGVLAVPARGAGTAAAATAVATGYAVTREIALPGDASWDAVAVDPAARRVYVSHGDRVAVLDADATAPVGEMAGLAGARGLALAPGLGRGYLAGGAAGNLVVFDLATRAVIGEWKIAGARPEVVVYEPHSDRVLAFDRRSATATVLEARSGGGVATVALGGQPAAAVEDGAGRVLAVLADTAELLILDPGRPAVVARHPLAPCRAPAALAVDRPHARLWVACGNALALAVDAVRGTVLAALPTDAGSGGVAVDPAAGYAFVANDTGTLSVLAEGRPGTFVRRETVATRRGARTVAVDERTHRLFLPTAELEAPAAATPATPHPRANPRPGTFAVLVVERP